MIGNKHGPDNPWLTKTGTKIEAIDQEIDIEALKKFLQGTSSNPDNRLWRVAEVTKNDDTIKTIATDLPGVHPNSIVINISDGKITIVCQRFDTNQTIERSYDIGYKFDPTTAEAQVAHGVLTIQIKMQKIFKKRTLQIKSPND